MTQLWLLDAVVETSEGSAMHANHTVAVCQSADKAKAIAQSFYERSLLWISEGRLLKVSVTPSRRINSEPIIAWEIYAISADEALEEVAVNP